MRSRPVVGSPAPCPAIVWPSSAAAGGWSGPSCESHGIHCIAGRGAIRDSSLGLTEALWVGPEARGVYIGSPSVWRTDAGPVLATHDFFGGANQDSTLNSTVQVLIELSGRGDAGVWQHTGNVSGICASPSPLLLLDLSIVLLIDSARSRSSFFSFYINP